jgi:flagellar hook-length control protein FliK
LKIGLNLNANLVQPLYSKNSTNKDSDFINEIFKNLNLDNLNLDNINIQEINISKSESQIKNISDFISLDDIDKENVDLESICEYICMYINYFANIESTKSSDLETTNKFISNIENKLSLGNNIKPDIDINLKNELKVILENNPDVLKEIKVIIKENKLTEYIDKNFKENKDIRKFLESRTDTKNKEINNEINTTKLNIDKDMELINRISLGKYVQAVNKEDKSKDLKILEEIIKGTDKKQNDMNFINSKEQYNISNSDIDNINTETINIQKSNIIEGTVKVMSHMRKNNIEELTFNIAPKELGSITIKLIKELDELKAFITVNKKDTLDIFNGNLQDIKNHLNNLNINVKEIVINVQSQENSFLGGEFQQQFKNSNNQNNNTNGQDSKEIISKDTGHIEDTQDNNINLLA